MDKTQLTYKEFQDLVSQGNRTIPVYKRILADLLTPVAAWIHLSQKAKYAFILESVEKGNQYTRYSYVGINPKQILTHKNGQTIIYKNGNKIKIVFILNLNINFFSYIVIHISTLYYLSMIFLAYDSSIYVV